MTSVQLDLFPEAPRRCEWLTRVLPDRSGMSAYVIMIRGKADPERPPQPRQHSQRDKTPHLTLRKQTRHAWRDSFVMLLGDGEPRTFNALCVLLSGLTADICAGLVPEDALWSLVEEGAVEFTMEAPVLFRRTSRNTQTADHARE